VPAKAQTPVQPTTFPLAIERLRIVGANAEFADLSLTPQFGTRMHDLTGVVTGLSTDPATLALVELDGKVDEFGSARVRGSIQPFRATDFTDLKLTFHNLEMTNLTPYSGKFAGRKIDSGNLSVDLGYKIKQRRLAGENKFVINKLKLGNRVDSPDAIKLPLNLAIALLEDSNGIIDLDLPVTGSLDDPEFSYGRIIWKAIVNVLTKLVTAPFRALGSLLGISSDKLEAVEFDFGATTLLPPEQEKLKNIGQALAKRPALTFSIAPAYEVKGDMRAIQELRIRRDVAQHMGLKVEPDREPGPVDTTNPRAQKALEALYGERFDKQGGVRAIKAEYKKPKDSVKPIHAEMLERLTLKIPVTDAELQRLAQARGEAVKHTLITLGNVDAAKISVGAPVKNDDDGKVIVCKMSLGADKKPAAELAPLPAAAKP
jgi:outer membrane protein OmpA-like peptidoglycan-associated protein